MTTTRRLLQREATLADIKAAAWSDMARSGSVEVSLRGVARELGMAVSALYRYFSSRDELITALVIDSFDSLSEQMQQALDTAPDGTDVVELFVRVGSAYQQWALAEPLRYRLAYGSPIGGYTGTDATTAAAQRSKGVLLTIMVRAVAAGRIDVDRVDGLLTPGLRAALLAWSATLPEPLPAAALGAALVCNAALHGATDVAVNGHLPRELTGSGSDVFALTLRHTVSSVTR